MTQRIELFLKNITQKLLTFFDMTHRIELRFRKWLTSLIEIEPFFSTWVKENDSIFSMTRRIFTKNLTQRIMILSLEILTQRIDYCEQKYDSENWTFESVTQSTEPSFSIWVNESNPLFQYESKNWTLFKIWLEELNFFWILTQRIDFFWILTQRIEPFFWIWLEEWTFFLGYDAKIDPFLLNFDNKELNFLFKNDSMNWIWLKGLNLFFFFNLTQRIELFVCIKMWFKELNFWTLLQIWLTLRIQPFWTFSYDSTNWTYFTWLKELNPIELSLKKNWIFFFMTQRIEPFLKRLNELNIFLWSKNCTFFVECDPKNWIFFVECDPKNWINVEKHEELILFTNMTENWTLFEPFHMTRRNEHFLIWLKE